MIDMTLAQHEAFERSVDGLMELAVKAGYSDNMGFSTGKAVFTPDARNKLVRFSIAILGDLYGGKKIDDIMLDRIVDLAVKFGGHTAIENVPLTDVMALVKASATELFFVRFAYAIAAENEKRK
jgi:hypothetical protein